MTLPVRNCSGVVILDDAGENVYLVTSSKDKTKWVLPKGGIEAGLTAEENAQKECREEAGCAVRLHGEVVTISSERKFHEEMNGPYTSVDTYFLASFVTLVPWEEYQLRKRGWFSIEEAKQMMHSHLHEPLLKAVERRNELEEAYAFP